MKNGWLKLRRCEKTRELLKDPIAFTLATIIAYRSKRNRSFNIHNLSAGQALIGDYKNYGMTQKQYREAKKRLGKWQIAAFQGTSKGTIATLCDDSLYDINVEQDGEQDGNQTANEGRLIRSKEDYTLSPPYNPPPKLNNDFDPFWQMYPRKVGKGEAQKSWARINFTNGLFEQILVAVEKQKKSRQWNRDHGRYIPNPATWLNQKRWLDELEIDNGDRQNDTDNSEHKRQVFIR